MNEQYRFDHYDALIFDMDGTLVDSMPLHLDAWELTCAEFGIPFEREQLYQYGGIPTRKIIAMLAEQQGLTVDVEAFTRRKIALYMAHIDKVSVFPKMWELVRHYHGKVKMGIGTGSPRSQADSILKSTGLDAYISVVVSADDVTNHKPHPDTFCGWPNCSAPIPTTVWYLKIPASGLRQARRQGWIPCWLSKVTCTSGKRLRASRQTDQRVP